MSTETDPPVNPEAPETPEAPQIGTPEYDAMMVEKWAKANPDKIPENFETPEDFANSYKELQADHTRKSQELANLKKAEEADPDPEPTGDTLQIPEGDPPAEAADEGPLDWDALEAEYLSTGSLSEETYTKLDNAGFPRAKVDQYVAGIKATQRLQRQEAANLVGGEKELDRLIGWASKNLSKEERDAMNDQLSTANWKRVLLGLQSEMAAAQPTVGEPRHIEGQPGTSTSVKPFNDQKEMTQAMSDPRYKTDPEYRAKVEERVRANSRTVVR